MADTEALSTPLASMSLLNAPRIADKNGESTTRVNLLLPRELRDKIWSYLLRHEHVQAAPYRQRSSDKRGMVGRATVTLKWNVRRDRMRFC